MSKSPDPTDIHVGKRLRMRRLMLKMSQTELGQSVGITFQQVQKYEKGRNRISSSRLQQFANVLDVPHVALPVHFHLSAHSDAVLDRLRACAA